MSNNLELNFSLMPDELNLLLKIIALEKDQRLQINSSELKTNFDWNLFVKLAMHHRLFPLLYSKLKMVDTKIIPHHVIETIQIEYKKNTFKMLYLSAEMDQINKSFMEKEIRLIVLKGPVLAIELFGDLSLRTCGDLDVLVPINDLKKVDKLLSGMGYLKEDDFDTQLNDWKWRHHHITYIHSQKGVKIEIHWRLNPGPGKEPTFDELWERKRESSVSNTSIFFLGKEDLFFFLVTHGARHGWFRLRWILDIHAMVKKEMDCTKAISILEKYQSLDIGGQALILTSQLLNTLIKEEMNSLVNRKIAKHLAQNSVFYFERIINLHEEPLPDDIAKYHRKYLFSLKSNQQKFLMIMSFLYPAITDVKTFKLPKSLYFLYFPLRPILWTIRKTRKHSLS